MGNARLVFILLLSNVLASQSSELLPLRSELEHLLEAFLTYNTQFFPLTPKGPHSFISLILWINEDHVISMSH